MWGRKSRAVARTSGEECGRSRDGLRVPLGKMQTCGFAERGRCTRRSCGEKGANRGTKTIETGNQCYCVKERNDSVSLLLCAGVGDERINHKIAVV